MNERIKELYNKVFAESMNMRWNIEDAEKFAELIVKECAKIAFQNDIAKFTRDGYRIGLDIQKHFGVDSE